MKNIQINEYTGEQRNEIILHIVYPTCILLFIMLCWMLTEAFGLHRQIAPLLLQSFEWQNSCTDLVITLILNIKAYTNSCEEKAILPMNPSCFKPFDSQNYNSNLQISVFFLSRSSYGHISRMAGKSQSYSKI